MKRLQLILLLLLTALFFASCQAGVGEADSTPNSEEEPQEEAETLEVSFKESTSHLVNPERGFYGGAVDIFKASSPVTVNSAKALREQGITLMYVGFYLQSFMNGDISQSYLDMVQNSMDAIRQAGIKCVLRFAYQNRESSKPWDAPIDVILRHVEQLKPILQKNADVIFVLQAGFIGVWGEWYYTESFGGGGDRRYQNGDKSAFNIDFAARKSVVEKILSSLPSDRQMALRTPQFKLGMYNLALKDTLTAATAHNGSAISRLAGHNDCFGASAEDYGTFDNVQNDREFWQADSRYFIMGGETCALSDYCTCQVSLKDMEDYHWTYLNSGYNGDVLDRWTNKGCMYEIKDRLGYRLVMKNASCTGVFKEGKKAHIKMNLENKGFAAPMNPRNAELVFVDDKGTSSRFTIESDPRTWHPGTHTVEADVTLPAAKGVFYLALEDPLLPERPEYSIALANEGVFDKATGWNKLLEIK